MEYTSIHSRLSRRRALAAAGTGAIGLATAALIGCSSSSKPQAARPAGISAVSGPVASAQPKRGGTLRFAENKNPDTLDPVRSGGGLPTQADLIYSSLFAFEPGDRAPASGKVRGDLVETWEQPDLTTLVLHLNKAAKFDERAPMTGRAVNADDVVQSWDRFAKFDTYRTLLANSANKDAAIETMTAVDASTVRVKLKFPDPTVLPLLTTRFFVQPVEGVLGKFDLAKEPRGSGPFLLESYQSSVSFTFKRNPNWFLGGGGERPYVDGLFIPIIPEQAQLEVQFRAKKMHFGAVSQTNIPQFAKDLDGTELAVTGPVAGSPTLVFSYAPGQPWNDVRVRRAVSMAVDRDAMAGILFDPKQFEPLGVKLSTYWNAPIAACFGAYWLDPKSTKFGPAAQYLQYNVAESTKMLAAAGYSGAKPLEMDNVYPGIQWGTNWPQRVEIIQSMMQKAGIKMNAVSVDYTTDYTPNYMRSKSLFKGKKTEAAVHFMPGGTTPDPLAYYFQRLHSSGASTETGTKFPELDERIRKQRDVSSFDERVAGIHDLNRWVTDNMINFPVGPNTEGVDLVWKALRGPQRYRAWLSALSPKDHWPNYWFQEPI